VANTAELIDMGADIHMCDTPFVLLTAAHNEEANIARALQSVVQQSVLPKRWVIISDNSTDCTDEIIRKYTERHDFIKFVRVARPPGHDFAAKILALRKGFKLLQGVEYGFIGNLDADISLEPTYFQQLRQRMAETPSLGIASGFVYEELDGRLQAREHNRNHSVPHAAQLVRRECYEAIGGYAILKFGGEDTHASTSARMKGWQARSFPDLKIYHQRHTGNRGGQLRSAFRQGQMEYHLGYDILFEFLKCIGRMRERPFFVGGFLRLLGFAWPHIQKDKRAVTEEFVAFIRKEQRKRLSSFFVSRRTEPRP
jgi:glycosyltransferase involved in cell wall biosynthesis